MLDLRQIHPLTDFLRHHKEHVARLKETRAPEVLTINGRAELVLQDADSYQALLDRLRALEDLVAVREGLSQAERGETRDADGFFDEFMSRNAVQG